MQKPNLALELIDRTLVIVHNARPPTDEDWEVLMEAWRTHLDIVVSQLIVSDGGGPNADQRRASLALIKGREEGAPATAVVSSSTLVRGVVTALSWFMKDRIKSFSHADLDEACRFLDLPRPASVYRVAVRRLHDQLA